MLIPGDQWPIFLYAGYAYDPEDPWKGLFQSHLLVSVSVCLTLSATESCPLMENIGKQRLTNTFLLRQAQSIRLPKPRGRAMPEFMA